MYGAIRISMNPISPLRSIWFHPARTIAFIAHENPGYRLFVLPVAAGLVTVPTAALFGDAYLGDSIGFAWASLVAFGPIAELLQVFVGAYLIRLTGAWLGGQAGSTSIQAAIVWGNVPIVAMTLFGVLALVFSFFYSEFAETPLEWGQSPVALAVGWALVFMQAMLVMWSLVIFLKGVAAVQGFTVGRAVLNTLFAWSIAAGLLALAIVGLGLTEYLGWLFFAGADGLVDIHAPQ